MTNPAALRWGYYGVQLPRAVHTHTYPRMMAANASSISRPGGTVGWLRNLRSEQGSWNIHAASWWLRHELRRHLGSQHHMRLPKARDSDGPLDYSYTHHHEYDHSQTTTPAASLRTRTNTQRWPPASSRSTPPSTDHLPIQVPRVKDKPRDEPSRITLRPASTTIFQSCRFSTNQDMSQDEPTRMGVTGPT